MHYLKDFQRNGGELLCVISYNGHELEVRAEAHESTEAECLVFAREVVSNLDTMIEVARKAAIRDLLEVYNSGWNEYDEVQEDGSLVAVSNPSLSPEEFSGKLLPKSVAVHDNDSVSIWFDDSELFWGHSVVSTSYDGIELEHFTASLFG